MAVPTTNNINAQLNRLPSQDKGARRVAFTEVLPKHRTASNDGDYEHQTKCRPRFVACCAWICLGVFGIVLTLLIVGVVFMSFLQSGLPEISVTKLQLSKFEISNSTNQDALLNAKVGILIKVANKNDKVELSYSNIEVNAVSENVKLGKKVVSGFSHNPGNTTYLNVTTVVVGDDVDREDASDLEDDKKKVEMVVQVTMKASIGFHVGIFSMNNVPILVADTNYTAQAWRLEWPSDYANSEVQAFYQRMANLLAHGGRKFKRLESRKSHSWWWDSHISPKNSKWLTENLEEMDLSIKRMLKLIEEDADSFAKKAEMYYQKRPVLISHVEEFYRMYRSLAERYDHVTGELRKNLPSDLQSQGSGISDLVSEPSSTWPSPDQRLGRRKSGPRAAGFEFFLGSGGSTSDTYQKEGDESSSLTDSEPESDDSSVNNYSGGDQGLSRKMIELEIELREAKEKLRMKEDNSHNTDGSCRGTTDEGSEIFFARMAGYEEELRIANEKLRISEVQIMRLKSELQKYKSSEFTNGLPTVFVPATLEDTHRQEDGVPMVTNRETELEEQCRGLETDQDSKVEGLMEDLKITKERLEDSQKEVSNLKHELKSNGLPEKVCHLQDELELAQKDVVMWKARLNAEKREVSKLQERIARLKTSLSDRDHEILDLKISVSDAEQKIFPEKAQVKAEISKLVEERGLLMEQLREWEQRARFLEDEIRKVKGEKVDLEEKLNSEIEQLKTTIVDRVECIEGLKNSLDGLKSERDQLNAQYITVKEDLTSKDKQMNEMSERMQQLQREHVELVSGVEKTHKLVEELRLREQKLKDEIESQRVLIMEGAEEKREAIRQLCFSIEHYRSGYYRLREVFIGQKRVPVLAS